MNGISHCAICGRPLKNPASVAAGIGPVCLGKMMKAGQSGQDPIADETLRQPMIPNIILKRAEDGHVLTNVPHICVEHSPTGFEYGYGGSGPSDLALNICEALLRQRGYKGAENKCWKGKCLEAAWILHLQFRDEFIANLPHEGGDIPYDVAQAWITEKMRQVFVDVPLEQEV